MEKFTDNQIIENYLKGDEKSLEILIQRYMDPIYRFVFSFAKDQQTAEDITQETFVKVWKNLKKVDKNKSFKSWIYTVAKNTALDFLKKKKSIPFSKFEIEDGKNLLIENLTSRENGPDKLAQLKETKEMFLAAINKLSEKYRTVLSLYYYKYMNFREIAEYMQEPVNTVKSRHRRGVIMLKKMNQILD